MFKKKYLVFIVCLWLLVSCKHSPEQVKVEKLPIPHDTMVVVLADIQVLESTLDLNIVPQFEDSVHLERYYNVLKAHHLSLTQYNDALAFYTNRPEELKQIYGQVVKRLQAQFENVYKYQ